MQFKYYQPRVCMVSLACHIAKFLMLLTCHITNCLMLLTCHIVKCLMLLICHIVKCLMLLTCHIVKCLMLSLWLNVLVPRSSIYVYTLTSLLQIFRRLWYYVTVPMWWLLVVYAVLDLILIYTYQFDVVSNAWDRAYQQTNLNISSEDL